MNAPGISAAGTVASRPDAAPGPPLQVLLVEDSPSDRLLTRAALQEAERPIAVHAVENGVEAMAFVRKEGRYADVVTPDLVLLDLNLPRMDGREVLARIKADPHLRHIPVVVLTTSASPDDVAAAYAAHANSFITKPVDFARLRDVLQLVERYWCEVVRLPDGRGGSRPVTPATAMQAMPASANRALRLLVVEDSPSDLLLLRQAIGTGLRDAELTATGDVATALARLADAPFDVIVTDLSLPDAVGLDAIRALRYAAPRTPILVLTGTSDVDGGEQALAAGADDYLVKDELTGGGIARAVRYAVRREEARADRQQRQRMESVGRLAAGVAHDFNNLLTAISASAELIGGARSSDEVRELVEEIVAATMRGRTLTRQLLAFSRRDRFDPQPVEVNSSLASIARLLQRLVGEGVEIRLQLGEGIPAVRADPHLLEQVVVNLALNARDAMEGRGILTLDSGVRALDAAGAASLQTIVRPGCYVTIGVSDTGPGIPDDVRARIFEPFFTTKEEGTGLGLATVREIVEQHGGAVLVDPHEGGGTTFVVLLPAMTEKQNGAVPAPPVQVAPAERTRGAATAPTVPTPSRDHTVLLVEDDGAVRRLVQLVLQRVGYRVLEADCADQAWQLWQDKEIEVDLVLTDMVMPGALSAIELARRINAAAPHVPIVFMSGYSGAFQDSGVSLVADQNFLAKPFTPDSLLRLVSRRLDAPAPGAAAQS